MPKKNVPIKYDSRDFASIKEALVQHAKTYYPQNFKDFNEAGFGSMMLDAVSYLGDQLSFYLDYQANESFLTTANEYSNVQKLAKQMGYKPRENPSSHGVATFFILVPANSTGLGPDTRYIPVLKRGSVFSTKSGKDFTLSEDVRFDRSDNEIVVGQVDDSTGVPTSYAIRGYGRVVSGRLEEVEITVGAFTRFLKVKINASNIAEVVSVTDSEGHDYYEVEYLSQDVIYRPILNRGSTNSYATSLLKPFTVPRRYVLDRDGRDVYLQFGHGSDSTTVAADNVADPSAVVLDVYGKEYITDASIDPTNLVKTDKFGIVPANTTLSVVVRVNTSTDVNTGVDTITNPVSPIFEFTDETSLNSALVQSVKTSIESTNEESITGDVNEPTAIEFKQRIFNSFATQNRAVTREDYKTLIYQMPPAFGAIKRANVLRDPDSFKRNLNIYVISNDENGKLVATNQTIKENLKVWLNKNRMINDTIDILDAKIVNFAIEFEVIGDLERDKYDTLTACNNALKKEFSIVRDVGENFFITDIYSALKKVKGVVDVTSVKVKLKTGGVYSDIRFNIEENKSSDGRYINIPENVIVEIKFPDSDIKGSIK